MKHEEIIKKIELADEYHIEIGGNFGRTMTITMEEAWLFKQLLEQQANGFSTGNGQSNIPHVMESVCEHRYTTAGTTEEFKEYCVKCGDKKY